MNTITNVEEVFDALEAFINRKPGLDKANYGCAPGQEPDRKRWWEGYKAYQQELRSIGKDGQRARAALDEARFLTPARPEALADAFRAFSGRLSWTTGDIIGWSDIGSPGKPYPLQNKGKLTYVTGAYYPTEYRKAAAAVLEAYIRGWKRIQAAENPKTFVYCTMAEVIAANSSTGGCWFEPSTMRFFKTKLETGLINGHRFITSEKGPDGVRRYTIRDARPDGSIDTVGEFQGYKTLKAARADVLKEKA